jgi:multisubunit Na+/H+ antiporter MnhG subunit
METNNNQELPQPALRQPVIGIAAFISGGLSLCMLLSYLGLIFAYLSFGAVWRMPFPYIWLAACSSGGLLGMVSLLLGIAALFQKDQKKVFAVLAIVEAILVVLLMAVSFFTLFIFTS